MTSSRTPDQARAVGRHVAIAQHRASTDVTVGTRMLLELLAECEQSLGPHDPVTLRIELDALAAQAETMNGTDVASAFADLAKRAVRALGARDRVTGAARSRAAQWQVRSGHAARGIASCEQELRWRQKELGAPAYRTCLARSQLVLALLGRGEPADLVRALELSEQDVEIRSRSFGSDHAFTWVATGVRAHTLLVVAEETSDPRERQARGEAAQVLTAELVARCESRFGRRNATTLRSLRAHARCLLVLGRCEEALWLLRRVQAAERITAELDPGLTSYYLALALSKTGRPGDVQRARELAENAWQRLAVPSQAASRDARRAHELRQQLARALKRSSVAP